MRQRLRKWWSWSGLGPDGRAIWLASCARWSDDPAEASSAAETLLAAADAEPGLGPASEALAVAVAELPHPVRRRAVRSLGPKLEHVLASPSAPVASLIALAHVRRDADLLATAGDRLVGDLDETGGGTVGAFTAAAHAVLTDGGTVPGRLAEAMVGVVAAQSRPDAALARATLLTLARCAATGTARATADDRDAWPALRSLLRRGGVGTADAVALLRDRRLVRAALAHLTAADASGPHGAGDRRDDVRLRVLLFDPRRLAALREESRTSGRRKGFPTTRIDQLLHADDGRFSADEGARLAVVRWFGVVPRPSGEREQRLAALLTDPSARVRHAVLREAAPRGLMPGLVSDLTLDADPRVARSAMLAASRADRGHDRTEGGRAEPGVSHLVRSPHAPVRRLARITAAVRNDRSNKRSPMAPPRPVSFAAACTAVRSELRCGDACRAVPALREAERLAQRAPASGGETIEKIAADISALRRHPDPGVRRQAARTLARVTRVLHRQWQPVRSATRPAPEEARA